MKHIEETTTTDCLGCPFFHRTDDEHMNGLWYCGKLDKQINIDPKEPEGFDVDEGNIYTFCPLPDAPPDRLVNSATYVKSVETENTGGGCMVDFITLTDGKVIALNDEVACLFDKREEFYQPDKEIASFTVHRSKKEYETAQKRLYAACQDVLDNWEKGDLAAAVNKMREALWEAQP